MTEAFVKQGENFANRAMYEQFNQDFKKGYTGIFYARHDLWNPTRRFSLTTFRNLGFGKACLEEKVLDVTKHFIKKIKADSANEHTNIVSHVNVCVASIINSILFSYDFNDERIAEFEVLKKILEDQVQLFQSPQLLMLIPYYKYVRHVPFLRRGFQQFFACQQALFNFFRGQIKEHLANHDPDLNEEPRDFVGAFLQQMHKDEKEKVENSDFNMDQILSL
uniref:Cytochrome P450 n=1 Tax=Rhabditophanes sp. KR3021 TaxID=114890 RepID=A0AC35UI67_9BILA